MNEKEVLKKLEEYGAAKQPSIADKMIARHQKGTSPGEALVAFIQLLLGFTFVSLALIYGLKAGSAAVDYTKVQAAEIVLDVQHRADSIKQAREAADSLLIDMQRYSK